jgi:hypothetical protein
MTYGAIRVKFGLAREPGIHNHGRGLWIPGSPPSVAPRNDQAVDMIRFHGNAPLAAPWRASGLVH